MTDTVTENSENEIFDKYRGIHEPEEHWLLRKNFMIANKGRVNESRLLCLSQLFANMEFLGCTYPQEVMDEVSEMSVGIVEKYRESQKSRLQRTFIGASSAAERKSKGSSGSDSNTRKIRDIKSPSSNSRDVQECLNELLEDCKRGIVEDEDVPNKIPGKNKKSSVFAEEIRKMRTSSFFNKYPDLTKLVLLEHLWVKERIPLQIIAASCGSCHIEMNYIAEPPPKKITPETIFRGNLKIGKFFSACGTGSSKDLAKADATLNAIFMLRKYCFTLQVKETHVATKNVNKRDLKPGAKPEPETAPISSNNMGAKMLKMMGWDGGGLGKSSDGMLNPIEVESCTRDRLGLGASRPLNSNIVKNFLLSQIDTSSILDVAFSAEFTTEERKIIHSVAQRLNFKTKSHGKEPNRFLVVSPRLSLPELVKEILDANGENPKYRVIQPGSYASSQPTE